MPSIIFYVRESTEDAFRVEEKAFEIRSSTFVEQASRLLCAHLDIPPLPSYMFSCCTFLNDGNTRRWMAPGEPLPPGRAEFRLCFRQFTPQQLAQLSEEAFNYHFLTVKYDLLKRRIRPDNIEQHKLSDFAARLINFDLCRILSKYSSYPDELTSTRDLVGSLVKKYQTLLSASGTPFKHNVIETLTKKFLWRNVPVLFHKKHLPDLVKKLDGKHWTDFAIAYLELLDKDCPGLRVNNYTVSMTNIDRAVDRSNRIFESIELGTDGLSLRTNLLSKRHICTVELISRAAFLTPLVVEVSIIGRERLVLGFDDEFDARSFAVELSCYRRIQRSFGCPLFLDTVPGIICPSQRQQQFLNCYGPLSDGTDELAAYEASVILGQYANKNAIIFESSRAYDVIGLIVVGEQSRQSIRWLKMSRELNGAYSFQDTFDNTIHQSVDGAATALLNSLSIRPNPEAGQYRANQLNVLFEGHEPLHPFRLINNDTTIVVARPRRSRQIVSDRGYNIRELARVNDQVVLLKYIHWRWQHSQAVADAFARSQNFALELKARLDQDQEGAGLVFRRLLSTINRETAFCPKCMIMEYLEESIVDVLAANGWRYSLYHLIQACLDIAEAVSFLHQHNLVHGEISIEKIFVGQKPASNGFGPFHVKLAEPNFGYLVRPDPELRSIPRSKEKDLSDMGKTFQKLFLLSAASDVKAIDHLQMAIDFSPFKKGDRYRPHLPPSHFQMATDHLQTIILRLMGNENARPSAERVKSELGTLLNSVIVTTFMDDPYAIDGDAIMSTRQYYSCGGEDLQLAAPNFEQACLGRGAFGVVYKVRHKTTGQIFALKELNIQQNPDDYAINIRHLTDDFRTELDVHLRLQHQNIVALRGIQYDKHGLITGILMSYEEKGSLRSYLRNAALPIPDERQKLKWALEIATGMVYLHSKDLVHRDLAARNVLLAGDLTAKITDFGLTACGLVYPVETVPMVWWPPEWHAIDDQQHEDNVMARYESSGDVYSYGVTLWELDNNGANPRALIENPNGSARLQSLIRKCMVTEPSQRPTFDNLIQRIYIMY